MLLTEEEAKKRKRQRHTLPRFYAPSAELRDRFSRRYIDCATCPLFRQERPEMSVGLYPVGFCDWRVQGEIKIDGVPPWAAEVLHQLIRMSAPTYSGNPRKGKCSAKALLTHQSQAAQEVKQ